MSDTASLIKPVDPAVAASAPTHYTLSHLDSLEAEAIHVIREVAAELRHPAVLFSGGKDSAVVLHLAEKALAPASLPFAVLHVDTGHNFAETLEFRDWRVEQSRCRLVVGHVQHDIDAGRVFEEMGAGATRNRLQTATLLRVVQEQGFDALLCGGRRDEERARAKERIFSHRDAFGQWDPKNQRPELWDLYNPKLAAGEHLRVFPLSNWTELDVWRYIEREGITLPSLYFAHRREVFRRDGMLMAMNPYATLRPGEEVEVAMVRFRTVGDVTCTAAVASHATTVAEVISETASATVSERGATRADDRFSEAGMEDRKREGYF